MPYYAEYNNTVPSPSPVVGWYPVLDSNTPDGFDYPNLPAIDSLLQVTSAQWAARMANPSAWAVSNGALVAYTPPAPTPTLAQTAAAALASLYTITSPSLDLTAIPFAIDATTQVHISAEINALLLNGAFADGTATVAWPDATPEAVTHVFTVAQFKVFASLLGAYVAALYKVVNGTLATLPANEITVS